MDPNLVRLAFVLVTVLTTGAGALLYVLLVLVLPEEDVVPTSGPPAPVAPTAPVASEPSPPRNGPEDGQTAPDQAPSNPGR